MTMVAFVVTAGVGLVVALLMGDWFWVLALPCALFLYFAYGTIRCVRDVGRSERLFAALVQRGLGESEALLELSRARHPELSPETHVRLVAALPDLDMFLSFMINAVDFGKREEKKDDVVLALLECTRLIYTGQGVYEAKVDWRRYRELLNRQK